MQDDNAVKETVAIGGAWLRRSGELVEMLVEVDGKWRLLASLLVGTAFSRIVEPSAIQAAPRDPLRREVLTDGGLGKMMRRYGMPVEVVDAPELAPPTTSTAGPDDPPAR